MKITVAQFNIKVNDLKNNYLKMKSLILKAIEKDYDMVVFGEYSLTGYGCQDNFKNNNFMEQVFYYQNKIRKLSDKIIIVFGGFYKKKQISVSLLAYDNFRLLTSNKENLNKREFNEKRYFISGENESFIIKNKTFLFTFRSDYMRHNFNNYDYVIIVDSSPVNWQLDKISKNVIYANTIGITQINKHIMINGGQSYINVDKCYAFKNPLDNGLIEKENQVLKQSKLDAIVKALRYFNNENFSKDTKWIVGSSGGIDSAITTALLTIAFGSDKVITYNLSSKYNQDKTINNAANLAKTLNIKHYENSIEPLVTQVKSSLCDFNYNEVSNFDLENIYARSRGFMLSAFSALENAIICNNSNKLELALGYATLYGDTIGAISPLGDLLKTDVFKLAKEINNYFQKEVIFENLIPKIDNYTLKWDVQPSAELSDNQVDPMKYYYHDLLLEMLELYEVEYILSLYLKNQLEQFEISKWLKFYNLDNGLNFINDFEWFTKTALRNSFKSLQTPPILTYSTNVIGIDYIDSKHFTKQNLRINKIKELIIAKYK